jgi:hypothetical protein
MASIGAVLVRTAERRAFIRADLLQQILPQPAISRVPASQLGMTLVAGQVISVLELGESTGALLVCTLDDELIGISGLSLERVGIFELRESMLSVDGQRLPELSLRELLRASRSPDRGRA